MPPAKGFKAEVKSEAKECKQTRVGSLGREGGGRALSEDPDQILEPTVKSCSDCGAEIARSEQQLMERYDKIEIPPIALIVTRVERYGCHCPQCGAAQLGAVPVGMEPGSPFGSRIAALVTTMRYSHGISYGRMQQMLSEVFGLEMSEGAIANSLLRVKGQLQTEVDGILTALRNAKTSGER